MYRIILNLHIILAFSFIGIITIIAGRWKKLFINKRGRKTLKKLHLFSAISGLLLFFTGINLLYILNGHFLLFNWMRFSIIIFIFIQLFDHFWADKKEKIIDEINSFSYLNIWLKLKIFLYLIILLLMYLKSF